MCNSLSEACEGKTLDGGIEKEEIAKCIRKQIIRLVVVMA